MIHRLFLGCSIFKRAIQNAMEFEKAMLRFKMIGVEPPIDEVMELARTTGLTLPEAADRIYWKFAGVEKPDSEGRE